MNGFRETQGRGEPGGERRAFKRVMGGRKRTVGQWEMERDRFQIEDEQPMTVWEESKNIAESVARLLKRLGMEDRSWMDALEKAWPEIVGASVAAHARPGRAERGVLTVFVKGTVWLNELKRYSSKNIERKVLERFRAKVKSVRFELDPD